MDSSFRMVASGKRRLTPSGEPEMSTHGRCSRIAFVFGSYGKICALQDNSAIAKIFTVPKKFSAAFTYGLAKAANS